MVLGFKTFIDKKATFFVEKIWQCIKEDRLVADPDVAYNTWYQKFRTNFSCHWGLPYASKPKRHTIRELHKKENGEISERQWRLGDLIFPVINRRQPNQFQFAPPLKCVSVQPIEIKYTKASAGGNLIYIGIDNKCFDTVNIDNPKYLSSFKLIERLAMNDGFDSLEDFFAHFNKDFTGVIIHWTNLKY